MATVNGAAITPLGEGVAGRTEYDSGKTQHATHFRADVQGLRAVAVTLVVLFHSGLSVISGGYIGVDVFFVISGYLITSSLVSEAERTGKVSIAGFYARRIRRLLPSALLVIAATVLVARVWGPAYESTRTAIDGIFAAFFAMNVRLINEGSAYQQAGTDPSPFQHFWSLAVEEQFYLVWPIIVIAVFMVVRRAAPVVRRVVLAAVVVAMIAVSGWVSMTVTATDSVEAYYAPYTRAWELGVGALLAIVQPLLSRVPPLLAAGATWVGLAFIGYSAVAFNAGTAFPGIAAAVPVAGAALAIAGGQSGSRFGIARVLRHRPTQLIGNVSYGWYLWHWPAIVLGPSLYGQQFGLFENLVVSVLALWLAILTYLLVERPALRRPPKLRWWAGVATAMSAMVLATSTAAVAMAPDLDGSGPAVESLDLAGKPGDEVRAAVAKALTTRKVPVNLEPRLADARTDQPETTTNGCHVDFTQTEQPECLFGDRDADRTIVLFGDSHAEQWFSALDRFGREDGWRVVSWTKAACPVADVTLVEPNLERRYTECQRWRTQRLDAVERLRPEVVIASQADTLAGPDYEDTAWGTGTARTIKRLSASAGSVVFLGDTPRPERDVPKCLAQNSGDARQCRTSATQQIPAESDLRYLVGRSRAAQQAAKSAGAAVVDPTPWLCADGVCPPVIANLLVYRDVSHVSDTYVTALTPLLRQHLPPRANVPPDVKEPR